MKIGDLFKSRESGLYPSIEEIVQRETKAAKFSFPNAKTDLEALALFCSSLCRNLQARTDERDNLLDGKNSWEDRG